MSAKGVRESLAVLEPAPVQALAALFDDGLPVPQAGDPLPPLWHWVALARWHPAGSIGPDGHPAVGDFLPDVGKPRRMFAGGQVDLLGSMIVGSEVHRVDKVLSMNRKKGRSGEFVVVQVESRIHDAGGHLCVVEVQDLVYRDAPPVVEPSSAVMASTDVVPAVLTSVEGRWTFQSDPTKLMRFSSATSNGHRIHYDYPYAVGVEGYPGLVVHGPLMTLALCEVLRLTGTGPIRRIAHRNLRPLFCGERANIEKATSASEEIGVTLGRGDAVCATLTATA